MLNILWNEDEDWLTTNNVSCVWNSYWASYEQKHAESERTE